MPSPNFIYFSCETKRQQLGIGQTNLQPLIPTYTTVKNSHNFTAYILKKLCFIYFLQLSIACNTTAPFSLHPYISRCTTLSGSHFVYVLCTSCSIGITLIKYKCKFRFCSARTNDIMQHFSDTNQQLHTTHVAYEYQSEPYSQTPHAFRFHLLYKKRSIFNQPI